jgi:phage-related protein
LAEAVENSREKLDRLKTAQEQVNEQFRKGEINEEQYRAFQREVAKAEQDLSKFERQLAATAKTTETWKDKLDKAQTSLKNVGAKMTDIGKDLSMKVTAPLVAAGAASFKMAADLQDAMGATEQIYKDAADSVKDWADNLDSYYGIAEGEALEYANMMGTMLVNIGGLTEEQAAKQAQTLIELAGDLTAMYGGTTADAVRALTGALKGNNTMLDNYGMAVNDAMIKTKALEMGLYDGTGQMDLATKQAATLALIMEQTGAAQGQAAREAEGASGGMRAFATEIKNLATDIGEVLLPVITPLLNRIGDIVKKFSELSPETQKIIIAIAGVAAAIGPLLVAVGMMSQGFGSIISLFGGASIAAGGLGASLSVLAGPIAAAIAAITLIVIAIKDLWQNNEDFRNAVKAIWEDIKNSIATIVNFLKALWDEHGKHFVNAGKATWEAIQTIISTVTQIIGQIIALFLNIVTGNWEGAWKNIQNIVKVGAEGVKKLIINLGTALKEIFAGLIGMALDWGRNLLQSFIDGIKEKWSVLLDTVRNIADTVADYLGFSSPTKKGPGRFIEEWGANMVKAFADGMNKELAPLQTSLGNMALGFSPVLAGGGASAVYTYNNDNRVINITVQDGEDLLRTLHRLGVRIP